MDKSILRHLHNLPCFKQVEKVTPISAGLSSHCYQVFADKQYYFVKKVIMTNEITVAKDAALNELSPKVIYHDNQWLITEYIGSENLLNHHKKLNEKIAISTKLMARCHQLKTQIDLFKPAKVIDDLINKSPSAIQESKELFVLIKSITAQLNLKNNLVCCHGDINFSNILINKENSTWLVDFECVTLAPAEYDLAMFIAVNNLARDKISRVVEHYQSDSILIIDESRLHNYLHYCYLINALWYTNAAMNNASSELKQLAQQQWNKLQLHVKMHNDIQGMISSIL